MRCEVRVGGFGAVAVVGLVLVSFTETVGQNRLSRSLDGPVTTESVERALVPVPESGADAAGVTEIGLSLRIQFDLDSAVLTPIAMRDLDRVALAFNGPELAASALTLEGHTDSSGEAGYNLRLSQLRADAVVAYLVSRGVAPDRMRAIGHGESRPLATLQHADPRQRRVEIVRPLTTTLIGTSDAHARTDQGELGLGVVAEQEMSGLDIDLRIETLSGTTLRSGGPGSNGVLRIGERAQVCFRVSQPGYVSLWIRSGDARAEQLYPNQYTPGSGRVDDNERCVGARGDGYAFRVEGPAGESLVFLHYSRDEAGQIRQEDFPAIRRARSRSPASYASSSVVFSVVE